jgi:hypothetical protein
MVPLVSLSELMTLEAPYLEDKLLRLKIVRSREQAFSLFQEVKKYLVLAKLHRSHTIPMFSRRVDEAWHQFVLFSGHYIDFSNRFFGTYVHHEPNEATKGASAPRTEMNFADFRAAYERLFGPISDIWFDELWLTPETRLLRGSFNKPVELRVVAGKAEIVLHRDPPLVLCRVDARAMPALEFALQCDAFYVRELPGLGQEERLALCKSLVQLHVLGIAP